MGGALCRSPSIVPTPPAAAPAPAPNTVAKALASTSPGVTSPRRGVLKLVSGGNTLYIGQEIKVWGAGSSTQRQLALIVDIIAGQGDLCSLQISVRLNLPPM